MAIFNSYVSLPEGMSFGTFFAAGRFARSEHCPHCDLGIPFGSSDCCKTARSWTKWVFRSTCTIYIILMYIYILLYIILWYVDISRWFSRPTCNSGGPFLSTPGCTSCISAGKPSRYRIQFSIVAAGSDGNAELNWLETDGDRFYGDEYHWISI